MMSAQAPTAASKRSAMRVALVGNPNTGKTTLFNRLCGLRAKTANFPGSTVEARVGHLPSGDRAVEIVDLPGVYALNLEMPESRLCRDCLDGRVAGCEPDVLLLVMDAMNLARNLQFGAQALGRGVPSVVALNMIDLAEQSGLAIDVEGLSGRLGCPVVAVCARSGRGIDELKRALDQARVAAPAMGESAGSAAWAAEVVRAHVRGEALAADRTLTDRLDRVFTHPVLGLLVFGVVMSALFMTIFSLAGVPMDLIEGAFGWAGAAVRAVMPEGAIADLLAEGVIGGVAGTLVFLPQICLLFFLLSLLEDTGYLARAALLMDRFLRRFGLPGQSFVPLLSSHACALPGMMAARLIPDTRQRLATVLVAPFMSCSARLPVYVLLTSLLFPDSPLLAGLAFAGCYLLGAIAAMGTALLLRTTILKGPARPMVLELPTYKRPSLRTALLTTVDRAAVFLKNAGTVILAICIIMWWLQAYPKMEQPAAPTLNVAAELKRADTAAAEEAAAELQMEQSYAGRLGRWVEPVFEPIGCERRMSIAVMTSFAAREVFVSTLTVLLGTGDDVEDPGVIDAVRQATRDDGSPLLTTASSSALLVFYVLAMQCLPTLAVTRRETGRWSWAMLQLGYMGAVAYVAAFITYQGLLLMGVT